MAQAKKSATSKEAAAPNAPCHAKFAAKAAGLPPTQTHPHKCEECGQIYTAANKSFAPKAATAPAATKAK